MSRCAEIEHVGVREEILGEVDLIAAGRFSSVLLFLKELCHPKQTIVFESVCVEFKIILLKDKFINILNRGRTTETESSEIRITH